MSKTNKSMKKADAEKAGYETRKMTTVGSVLIRPDGLLRTVSMHGKSHYNVALTVTHLLPGNYCKWKRDLGPSNDCASGCNRGGSVSRAWSLSDRGPGPSRRAAECNPAWDPIYVDRWTRRLGKTLFDRMNARYGVQKGPGRDQFHWALARRDHKKLVLAGKPSAVTGADLVRIRGSGRNLSSYAICFGEFFCGAVISVNCTHLISSHQTLRPACDLQQP